MRERARARAREREREREREIKALHMWYKEDLCVFNDRIHGTRILKCLPQTLNQVRQESARL